MKIDTAKISSRAANLKEAPAQEVVKQAIISNGIESVAYNNAISMGLQNNFSVELEAGKITSQEKSGRCWMFAGLNLFRKTVMEKLGIEDFEFSQNHTMFFDKLEKANYFLESILRTLEEDVYSRIIMHLLANPLQDGGQWDMFVNLIGKYGAVPKAVMPETFHSANSAMMNQLLTAKLREWAAVLRNEFKAGKSMENLRAVKEDYLVEFYRLLTYFLGSPASSFVYEYRNKEGKQCSLQEMSPQAFFRDFVQKDLSDYVSLIHAPTPDKPYGKTYTVDFLGNVIEGQPVRYLNVASGVLKAATMDQLRAGEPVWFGCDVRLQTHKKKGLMDPHVFLYDHALGTDFQFSKSDRLLYGESLLTHAMVFTGVHLDKGKPVRWKVENSWGEDRGEKGFFIMSDAWFDEFNYQVVVHKRFLGETERKQLEQEPVLLPPWDPMGSLAIMV